MSSDGTKAVAVWFRSNGAVDIVQAATATIINNVATWSTPGDLSATGGYAQSPVIGVSSDGTKAVAVWFRSNGANYIVQAATATIANNAASWSSPEDLSATGQDAVGPQIGVSSDGTKAVAVWYRSNGANNIVQAATATIINNVATWSTPGDLSATGGTANAPQIGVSSDGTKAVAVWYRNNPANDIVQAATATIANNVATWTSPSDLSAAGRNANAPQVGVSSDGTKAVAVWYRNNGVNNNTVQAAPASVWRTRCVVSRSPPPTSSGRAASGSGLNAVPSGITVVRGYAYVTNLGGDSVSMYAVSGTSPWLSGCGRQRG